MGKMGTNKGKMGRSFLVVALIISGRLQDQHDGVCDWSPANWGG